MDTRSTPKWIAAVFIVVGVVPSAAKLQAGSVHVYSGDFGLPIPSPDDPESEYGRGWMADAIIEIPDHHSISDLDIRLNVVHTSVFDLQIFLQSPAGTSLVLNMYDLDEFFIGADYTDTIFDDEAELPIEQGEAPFTGRFRPKAPSLLQVFDGQDSFGPWRLRIYDAWYFDTGTLDSFELIVTTPEPATAMLLILGAALMTLKRAPRTR